MSQDKFVAASGFRSIPDGQAQSARLTPVGGLHVDQGLPSYGELARQGRIYVATTAAGTAKPPITAWPTTTATFMLYNNNPASGTKQLVVLEAWAWSVSGTAGLGGALLTAVTLAAQTTVPADYTGVVISGTSGQAGGSSGAVFANAHTITGGTPAWRVVDTRQLVSAVSQGAGYKANLAGDTLVKPGHGMSVAVLGPVGTTHLFGYGVTFAVVDMAAA